jgi:putative component of membrane protein insertase Oxa1/YidC/SpoIIIJ protein YidD
MLMNVLSRWMNVTKIVTIMMHHIHVRVALASHLMMTSCTVMVTCKEYAYHKNIEFEFIRC